MADLQTLLNKFLVDLYNGTIGIPLGAAISYLVSPSANTIEQRNGTNTQVFNVYRTYTSTTDYERLAFVPGTTNDIRSENGSGGGTYRAIQLTGQTATLATGASTGAATPRWRVDVSGHLIGVADNSYDIGANGATRPRNVYVGTNTICAGYFQRSVGNGLTAAGNNRATALQLAAEVNNVTTAAASTGVLLPVGAVGMRVAIFNAGANSIQVYGSASETIDTVAGSTGVPLASTKRADFFYVAANTWISAQMGVISA